MLSGVKICGIRRPEDARCAVELGASAIGFVFWPDSPRYVDPDRARSIAATLPDGVDAVGVFVNQSPAAVVEIAGIVRLDAIQLHGDERVEDYDGIPEAIIKAVAIADDVEPSLERLPPGITVLLDAHDPIRRGGTGRTIDWTIAAAIARRRVTILSGGLDASNVAEAIARVRPSMVDVSSGVEAAPGRKDHDKLRAFFRAVQSATAALKASQTGARNQ